MILLAPPLPSKHTPAAWMMALCTSFLFPVPFSAWVTSAERYWVILAKRRRESRRTQGIEIPSRSSKAVCHRLGKRVRIDPAVADRIEASRTYGRPQRGTQYHVGPQNAVENDQRVGGCRLKAAGPTDRYKCPIPSSLRAPCVDESGEDYLYLSQEGPLPDGRGPVTGP